MAADLIRVAAALWQRLRCCAEAISHVRVCVCNTLWQRCSDKAGFFACLLTSGPCLPCWNLVCARSDLFCGGCVRTCESVCVQYLHRGSSRCLRVSEPLVSSETDRRPRPSGTKETMQPCPLYPACHLFSCAPPHQADRTATRVSLVVRRSHPRCAWMRTGTERERQQHDCLAHGCPVIRNKSDAPPAHPSTPPTPCYRYSHFEVWNHAISVAGGRQVNRESTTRVCVVRGQSRAVL